MSLTVNETGGGFKAIEPGTYVGICYRIVDLGTQHFTYEGKEQVKKQVMISWEFPEELIADGDAAGKPYSVSKFYTASLNEKATLRHDLETWRGKQFTAEELKGFALTNILGKPCMVSVVHTEAGKVKVGAVMALPKGVKAGKQVNPSSAFDIGDDLNGPLFDELPAGIQKMILASDEAKAKNAGESIDHGDDAPPTDDQIPF